MLIISDTSPIINLAVVNLLDLLPKLFSEIIIPTAVFNEIVVDGKGLPGAKEITQSDWVMVMTCSNQILIDKLSENLDAGEAEAIALAIEIKADYLLIDEVLGREIAQQYQLQPLGVLGILLRAKEEKHIQLIRPIMDKLKEEANFYIAQNLYFYVLELAGEK